MKKLAILAVIFVFAVSCQDEISERYKLEVPQYMSYDELRQPVKLEANVEGLQSPGKIYYWNSFLFVNEVNKGIHIIDNSDPSKPVFKKFVNIPGNVDISIKDGILYADSYIDLVALDITNIDNIVEVSRLDSIFPYTLPAVTSDYPIGEVDQKKGVVVGYRQEFVEQELYKPENRYFPRFGLADEMMFNAKSNMTVAPSGSGTGIGGSMARFTITGDKLYAISQSSQILIFDIKTVNKPVKVGELTVGWGIETLFPYNGKLFIGSQTGMIIYSLVNPSQPQFISNYSHMRSCDPVVVEGNFAYVTLRTGNRCFGNINRLDIVDISNIESPKEVKTYDMTNPHGLGIDGNTLFLSDGSAGLKIFDVTDKTKVNENMIAHYPENNAFDVIPLNGVLLMIGDSGLYQYNYENLKDIKLLSKIKIVNQ